MTKNNLVYPVFGIKGTSRFDYLYIDNNILLNFDKASKLDFLSSTFFPFMKRDLNTGPFNVLKCFVTGSPVLMANGSICAIESIRSGDSIAAFSDQLLSEAA